MENTKPAETIILCDADDFCEDNNRLDVLNYIKDRNQDFKISLFTIPGRCSPNFLEMARQIDWIRMYPHGWTHDTPRECQNWTYEQSKEYLDKIDGFGKVFKAPGWQISDGMYQALLERGYAVADQHYNDERRPKGLKVFYPTAHHYHIGNLGGINQNEIGLFADNLANLKGIFNFIL